MKKLSTFATPFLIAFTLVSQNAEKNFIYRHYEGTFGPYPAQMNIQVLDTEIHGCVYFQREDNPDSPPATLSGHIDTYGIAEMELYESDELRGYMTGKPGVEFNGFYRPVNSQNGRNFYFHEDYIESIRFDGYRISVDSLLTDSAGSPHAELDLSILLPENVDSNSYIRESVLKAFFGNSDFSSVPDDSILHTYSDIYFNKYIESNIDIHDGGHSFNWEMITSSSIVLNQKGIVCYRANSYGYTGGAHGMGISRFLTFDTKNKSQLSLEDIFIESYEGNIAALLEKKYREQMFMDEDQSLSDAGLFEEDIYASHNFWLTDESIGFFYNPYELAPYSMGSISISLHKDEIRHLLKEDAPVKRLGW